MKCLVIQCICLCNQEVQYPDLGYLRDDDGENISNKNAAYNILCKILGMKNLNVDYIGIAHYRIHIFQLIKV